MIALLLLAAQDCSACPRPAKLPAAVAEDGFEKLGPPKRGEWRDRFKEDPQSFEEYVQFAVNRRCKHRATFYIQPLGDAANTYA